MALHHESSSTIIGVHRKKGRKIMETEEGSRKRKENFDVNVSSLGNSSEACMHGHGGDAWGSLGERRFQLCDHAWPHVFPRRENRRP
jgi:hypothetical protein